MSLQSIQFEHQGHQTLVSLLLSQCLLASWAAVMKKNNNNNLLSYRVTYLATITTC